MNILRSSLRHVTPRSRRLWLTLLASTSLTISLVACDTADSVNEPVNAEMTPEGTNASGSIEIPEEQLTKDPEGKSDASALAVFLDFNFEGVLKTRFNFDLDRVIEQQLLYTIGQLNHDYAVGRLDQLKLHEVEAIPIAEGGFEVHYSASMLVAWSKKDRVPERYTLTLPYDTTLEGQRAFTEAYKSRCVSWGAHDVDEGSIWYYFRPLRSDCELKEEDVRRFEATISLSPVMTTGKYPEYHKVWEDDALHSLVIFGHAEESGPIESDVGFHGFRSYYTLLMNELRERGATEIKTTPEDLGYTPTAEQSDITVEATLPDGKRVVAHILLVKNVSTAGHQFDRRYRELSQDADLIVYNGHAGLGANVRALARKGSWREGQYTVFFMNGCDTYAYVDEALFESRAAVNPDDETGRKYVDIVNNAMPSYFFSMPRASMAMVAGLLDYESPRTYESMFARVDPSQVILVTGEEDNVFVPGYDPNRVDRPEPWAGISYESELKGNERWTFETPVLEPGTYRFSIEGWGDADLYIRLGQEPTMNDFDCRPFSLGSNESCEVEITTPTPVYGMVNAWFNDASFTLFGGALK